MVVLKRTIILTYATLVYPRLASEELLRKKLPRPTTTTQSNKLYTESSGRIYRHSLEYWLRTVSIETERIQFRPQWCPIRYRYRRTATAQAASFLSSLSSFANQIGFLEWKLTPTHPHAHQNRSQFPRTGPPTGKNGSYDNGNFIPHLARHAKLIRETAVWQLAFRRHC